MSESTGSDAGVIVVSGCADCDGGITVLSGSADCLITLQFCQDLMVVLVVSQLFQDLLVEHMMVHQQPSSAFEADRVQHAFWKEFIHHHALAYLWERTGHGRSGSRLIIAQ